MAPSPGLLPREVQGQRSLVGYSPQGHKRVGHDLATKQANKQTNKMCKMHTQRKRTLQRWRTGGESQQMKLSEYDAVTTGFNMT